MLKSLILPEVEVGQIVKNRSGKKVELGRGDEFSTCRFTEHRGWGSDCKFLVLKKDGYYHCGDCGLVFLKDLKLEPKIQASSVRCYCKRLSNFIEWIYDDFFDYDIPLSHYRCVKCGKVYNTDFESVAPEDLQKTEAAKAYARWVKKSLEERRMEKLSKVELAFDTFKTKLMELSENERKVFQQRLRKLVI